MAKDFGKIRPGRESRNSVPGVCVFTTTQSHYREEFVWKFCTGCYYLETHVIMHVEELAEEPNLKYFDFFWGGKQLGEKKRC